MGEERGGGGWVRSWERCECEKILSLLQFLPIVILWSGFFLEIWLEQGEKYNAVKTILPRPNHDPLLRVVHLLYTLYANCITFDVLYKLYVERSVPIKILWSGWEQRSVNELSMMNSFSGEVAISLSWRDIIISNKGIESISAHSYRSCLSERRKPNYKFHIKLVL